MIPIILSHLASSLSDFFRRSFSLNEDICCIKPLINISQSGQNNKIHLSLTNIERETTTGIQFNQNRVSPSYSQKGTPSWMLNIYVLFAVVFSEKQYEESLQVLSGVILFLQNNNIIKIPQSNLNFAIEPVNLSTNELSNLWSISGGNYYPSILCKIRVLNVDSKEIKQLQRIINQKEINI